MEKVLTCFKSRVETKERGSRSWRTHPLETMLNSSNVNLSTKIRNYRFFSYVSDNMLLSDNSDHYVENKSL